MLVVHVFVKVKADQIDAFKKATLENAATVCRNRVSRASTSSSRPMIRPDSFWLRRTAVPKQPYSIKKPPLSTVARYGRRDDGGARSSIKYTTCS